MQGDNVHVHMLGEGHPDGCGSGSGGSRERKKCCRESKCCRGSEHFGSTDQWIQPPGGGAASRKCLPVWKEDGEAEEKDVSRRRKDGKADGKGEEKSQRLEEGGKGRRWRECKRESEEENARK